MTLFGHYLLGWGWLAPLAIIFGINIKNWKLLFSFFGKLLFIGILISFLGLYLPEDKVYGLLGWMAFFPIILLTFFTQTRTNKVILLISISAYLFLSFQASQRINSVFLLLLVIFFIIEYFRQAKINLYLKAPLFLILIIISSLSLFQLSNTINQVSNNKQATTDTRTFLFEELYADMSKKELILGRGAMGTYYSPYFALLKRLEISGGDSATRSVVEVGYLQMILKGGYIMLFLYLLFLLPAAYLGIFKSHNSIARMSGYYILLYLLLWTVSYVPVYSAEYILLWMSAGTALSPSARKLRDEEILIQKK